MVDFQEEINDDPKTSGIGKFLNASDTLNVNCDGFLVDSPPHNAKFFSSQ